MIYWKCHEQFEFIDYHRHVFSKYQECMYSDLCNKLGAKFYFSKNAPHPSYLLAIFVVDLMMHFEFSKYLDKLQILPPFKKLTRAGQTLANALFSPLYTIDHPKVPLIKSCRGALFTKQNLRFGLVQAGLGSGVCGYFYLSLLFSRSQVVMKKSSNDTFFRSKRGIG